LCWGLYTRGERGGNAQRENIKKRGGEFLLQGNYFRGRGLQKSKFRYIIVVGSFEVCLEGGSKLVAYYYIKGYI
jgi:hypothetical protein